MYEIMLCGHKEYYHKSEKPDDICSGCEKTLKKQARMYMYAK